MRAILWAEFRQVLRRPTMYLLMLLLTVLFAATFGQKVTQDWTIPVFSEEMDQEEVDRMVERLSGYEPASFEAVEADEALRKIDAGEADIALELTEEGYRLLATDRATDVSMVEQLVRGVLEQERRLNRAAEELNQPPEKVEKEVAEYLKQPPLMLSVTTFRTEGGFRYDAQAQAVFGMTLFYAIYTITYTVSRILQRKKEGIWDRMIITPVSRARIFFAYLLFGFLLGYGQIALIFTLFRTAFRMDFGGSFGMVLLLCIPYVFVTIALGICLCAFIRSPQHLDAAVPLLAISSAMVGGAFWPIEIVSNDVLLFLSKLVPITYAMEMLKGVAVYGWGWREVAEPMTMLVAMGVILMGIGIHVMEKRHE